MQWQLSLVILAQPTLSEDGVRAKTDIISDLMSALSGEVEEDFEDEPMDDEDTLALLAMAGRQPIREYNVAG